MNPRLTTTILFLVVIASTAFVTHSLSKPEPTTEEISIDTLLARIDRDMTTLRASVQKSIRTYQDTVTFVGVDRKMFYVQGARDAFASLRQKTVWLDKEKK